MYIIFIGVNVVGMYTTTIYVAFYTHKHCMYNMHTTFINIV